MPTDSFLHGKGRAVFTTMIILSFTSDNFLITKRHLIKIQKTRPNVSWAVHA